MFEVATHKVEYTHEMQAVRERHLSVRNECVADIEQACGWPRAPARAAADAGELAARGLHALITGVIQNWLLDPRPSTWSAPARRR